MISSVIEPGVRKVEDMSVQQAERIEHQDEIGRIK